MKNKNSQNFPEFNLGEKDRIVIEQIIKKRNKNKTKNNIKVL